MMTRRRKTKHLKRTMSCRAFQDDGENKNEEHEEKKEEDVLEAHDARQGMPSWQKGGG